MDRYSRQNFSKTTEILNDINDQLDLIAIFMTLHQKKKKSTFFSNAHWIFFRLDHIQGYKTSLSKFKRTEIISSIYSDPQYHETGSQPQKEKWEKMISWRLNNMLQKTNGSVMKSERKLKNSSRHKTMKTQPYKIYGVQQSSPKRDVHSNS